MTVYLNHSDYISIGQNVSIHAHAEGVFLEMELGENERGTLGAVKSNCLYSCSFGFVYKMKKCLLDCEGAYNNTEIMENRFLNVPFNNIEVKRKKLALL